ncbi:MAG TPA: ROK family protein [Candidatus Binataceae bacterium]|nr:ROK family protein [Candidatus Binataceae bacterium]
MKKNDSAAVSKPSSRRPLRTLAVDIGGTGIKTMILDQAGAPLTERLREPTPKKAKPKAVLKVVRELATRQGEFDRVSAGFPGVVKDGVVYSAPNLGKGWEGVNLREALEKKLDRPARVANDADVQGLGSVTGRGLELVITLGTGFGSVLFANGTRIHLELGHHPFHKGKTYEEELGIRALEKKGVKRWNRMLREALDDLKRTFNYDRLYIGGGSAKQIALKLPDNVKIVSNTEGLLGGIKLWSEPDSPAAKPATDAERLDTSPGSSNGATSTLAKAGTRNLSKPANIPPREG